MLPGSNATVIVEHLTQTRDPHGAKVDGDPDRTDPPTEAVIQRPSASNLWRITVAGNYAEIAKAPSEWRITDSLGNVYGPSKVTYRPPIERLGESEHTLIFAEAKGEKNLAEAI